MRKLVKFTVEKKPPKKKLTLSTACVRLALRSKRQNVLCPRWLRRLSYCLVLAMAI